MYNVYCMQKVQESLDSESVHVCLFVCAAQCRLACTYGMVGYVHHPCV